MLLRKHARLKMRNSRSQDLAQTAMLQEPSIPLAAVIRSTSRMQHHIFEVLPKVKNGAQCQPFLLSKYHKHLQAHLHDWKILSQ